jgi:FlaA1/EpsC-like NDP-sugar epimerase
MGKPVRINDVAKRLASNALEPVDILYTGLRPGEKIHETLFGCEEVDDRPVHPLISHVRVPPLDVAECSNLDVVASAADLKAMLETACQRVYAVTGE